VFKLDTTGNETVLHSANRPVNVYLTARDVPKNSVAGSRAPPDIMMFGETIHRDCDPYAGNGCPLLRNWDHSARDNHGADTHFTQDRQQTAQFAMPNQRLSADQR